MWEIHRWPVNSPHKGSVTWRMFPFDDVIMSNEISLAQILPCQLYAKGIACWEVTWPNDPQTRCCGCTGIPLDRLHWNYNGWCYHQVVFQWQSRAHHLHNWNIMERPLEPQEHWDANGTTLADATAQWCYSGNPVLICISGTHWKTTGRPLQYHRDATGTTLAINNSFHELVLV